MADIRVKYGTQANVGSSYAALAGLASDNTNGIAGWASQVVTNSANDIDHIFSGKLRVNASTAPTANNTIEVWTYAQIDDTPTYPDSISGSDGLKTMTSLNVLNSALRVVTIMLVDAVANRDYFIPATSIASLYGGVMPKRWGVWILNRTNQTLNATTTNFSLVYLPLQYQTV